MKLLKLLPLITTSAILLAVSAYPANVSAQTEFTIDEVSEHNTASDCWMIFEDSVYDITTYIIRHDKYLDIRIWCGNDMTEDFKDKAGVDRDHIPSSYALLENLQVGDLEEDVEIDSTVPISDPVDNPEEIAATPPEITTDVNQETQDPTENNKPANPYNFLLPFLLTVILYTVWYQLSSSKYSKKHIALKRPIFNLFWNSVLLLGLIPAVGFGIFMIMRYSKPALWNIDFDFMYWHVELSIIFGTVAILHLLTRLTAYIAPAKALMKRKQAD